jgi:glycosyltransferase involved in cell wall biosynthesis
MTSPTLSSSHLVLIPSYDTGARLLSTVAGALERWAPVWVVIDGSRDGSERPLLELARQEPRLRVLVRPTNGGKGAAIATGVAAALAAGFTHVLTMDADGQHPAAEIPRFMAASLARPAALVLGRPVFGPEAPAARCQGRKLSIAMAWVEILGPGIDDPLFGFRVYPAGPLSQILAGTAWARGFDFDHEAAVRLFWAGTPTVNLPAACRYLAPAEGGVSHFRYVRDNILLVWLQLRLLGELLAWRWFPLARRRYRTDRPPAARQTIPR